MRRASWVSLLASCGLLSAGCCCVRHVPQGPELIANDCHTGTPCGGVVERVVEPVARLAGAGTCGERYVDEWLSHPPACCDPCDPCTGDWTGDHGCCDRMPGYWLLKLWGVRYCGGCEPGCSYCDTCSPTHHPHYVDHPQHVLPPGPVLDGPVPTEETLPAPSDEGLPAPREMRMTRLPDRPPASMSTGRGGRPAPRLPLMWVPPASGRPVRR